VLAPSLDSLLHCPRDLPAMTQTTRKPIVRIPHDAQYSVLGVPFHVPCVVDPRIGVLKRVDQVRYVAHLIQRLPELSGGELTGIPDDASLIHPDPAGPRSGPVLAPSDHTVVKVNHRSELVAKLIEDRMMPAPPHCQHHPDYASQLKLPP
jgi:hypothetical protein